MTRNDLEKVVKAGLAEYVKSTCLAKNAVKDVSLKSMLTSFEKHVSHLDASALSSLRQSYSLVKNDIIINEFFNMCICNVIDDREVNYDSVMTLDGNDITQQFSLLVVLACIPHYELVIQSFIRNHGLSDDYVHNMMGKLRYRVKLNSITCDKVGVAGGVNVVLWIQQHIHKRRISFTCIDIESMTYKKQEFKTADEVVNSLQDGSLICQVHIIDDRKLTGAYEFVSTIINANKFFFDVFGFYPQAYIFCAWTLDPTWKVLFPNSFLSSVCTNVHMVDDLKEESDEIFFYVYGKKCDPRSYPADTALKKYLVKNFNKVFYVHFGIVAVKDGEVQFEKSSLKV